jgi:hypothetical protein
MVVKTDVVANDCGAVAYDDVVDNEDYGGHFDDVHVVVLVFDDNDDDDDVYLLL